MPERLIRPACLALLVMAWLLDLVTPELFIASVLLNGPIALSSLALDSRFTQRLVWLAILADFSAGYENGVVVGHHWAPIAYADRAISALSFLLVGWLCVAAQRASRRAGELAVRTDRATRERSVQRAVEVVRNSINEELVARAIVREAPPALGADRALFVAFDSDGAARTTYRCELGGEVALATEAPPAPLRSLAHRVARGRESVAIDDEVAVGGLVLEALRARYAIAAPAIDHATVYGVLIVARDATPFGRDDVALRSFVDQAAIALAQAALFSQVAGRNAELAAANAALRERSDVIRDLVYALSHDLRTPLAAAGMTLRQALAGAYGALPAAYRPIVERTVLSNDELQRLAETLVLVSRYEAGEASPRRDAVDLTEIARAAVHELESLWRAKALDLTTAAVDPASVAGDAGELRRAVVNLLANAIAFTPTGGAIVVTVDTIGTEVRLVVDDDGYGVPGAQRARLFERLGADSSRQGAGTGLGLYIVRRIAESHGGRVAYEPKPAGGSIFTIVLPATVAAAAAATDRAPA